MILCDIVTIKKCIVAALYVRSSLSSKTIVKRNLPSGRTLDRVQERWKEFQTYTSSLIMQVWLAGQDVERTQVENWCQQGLGKRPIVRLIGMNT